MESSVIKIAEDEEDSCSEQEATEHKTASVGETGGPTVSYLAPLLWKADPAKVKDGDPSSASDLAPAWRMFLLGNGSPTRHLRLLTGRRTHVEVIEMKEIGNVVDPLAPSEVELVPAPRLRRQVFLKTEDGVILGYAVSYWNVQTGMLMLFTRSENLDRAEAHRLLGLSLFVSPFRRNKVHEHLKDKSVPIFTSFTGERAELFREINGLYCGKNARLARAFGAKDSEEDRDSTAAACRIAEDSDSIIIASSSSSTKAREQGPNLYGRHYTFYHGGRPLTVIVEVYNERTLEPFLGKIRKAK